MGFTVLYPKLIRLVTLPFLGKNRSWIIIVVLVSRSRSWELGVGSSELGVRSSELVGTSTTLSAHLTDFRQSLSTIHHPPFTPTLAVSFFTRKGLIIASSGNYSDSTDIHPNRSNYRCCRSNSCTSRVNIINQ